jgi:DNA-binding protein YbaB
MLGWEPTVSEQILDKHGEQLEIDSRVMLDGAQVATVLSVDSVNGIVRVQIDGEEDTVGWRELRCKPTSWSAPEMESLGDGINQAMRAAQGQPS